MQEPRQNYFFKNLANLVSLLGVLPLCVLFAPNGYQYLLPLVIYNNVMDDLDGILAVRLKIGSYFGALLDNVCDAISHTIIMMVIAMHIIATSGNPYLAAACLVTSLVAIAAVIIRGVARIDPASPTGTGSPTNELIRHVFFILLLAQIFDFDPAAVLTVACVLHTVSMLVPFKMPLLIRSMTKSPGAITLVNVALLIAWLVPYAAPIIAAAFFGTYLVSFVYGMMKWFRNPESRIAD